MEVKIVFSGDCYSKIRQMSLGAMNNNREYGRFFVGRIISVKPTVIYFDYCTSEFECVRGPAGENTAVIPSDDNYDELNHKISEYRKKGIKPVVLHFHSHPRFGFYESFSDQDLQTYAKMQAENPHCISLGMLGFPVVNSQSTFGMCIVSPENSRIVNTPCT